MKRLGLVISLVFGASVAFTPPALAAAPGNDTWVGRTVIGSLPFTDSVDTSQATTDADDTEINASCGAPATDASVWYQFTAPSNETITIDASGSTYPSGAIVATGSPGNFNFVTCGFFSGGGAEPRPYATGGPLFFDAISGETYSIVAFDPQFDGSGNGGTLNITFDVAPPPPVVHVTVNGTGSFNRHTGSAKVSGTVTCSGGDFGAVNVTLSQTVGRFVISGFGGTDFVCDGSTHQWTAEVIPFNGLFKGGRAVAQVEADSCGTVQCGFDAKTVSIRLH